jgi:hypothetical protein
MVRSRYPVLRAFHALALPFTIASPVIPEAQTFSHLSPALQVFSTLVFVVPSGMNGTATDAMANHNSSYCLWCGPCAGIYYVLGKGKSTPSWRVTQMSFFGMHL